MRTVNLPEKTETIRVHVNLTYDGADSHDWTAQPGLRTVQGEIETALALVTRMSFVLTIAGHTDAGVYARRQVAHANILLDAWRALTPRGVDRGDGTAVDTTLTRRLNVLIAQTHGEWGRRHELLIPRGSSDTVISRINRASAGFDARFNVPRWSYRYWICKGAPGPLCRRDVLDVSGLLNLEAMNRGTATLLGEHDFLSYYHPRGGATAIRTLRRLKFTRFGGIIECRAETDTFCHFIVHSLVDAHLPIGQGKKPESWPVQLLEKCSREGATPIAPAHGLTLEDVHYPEEGQWAPRMKTARRRRDCYQED